MPEILVATDGSETASAATQAAIELASASGDRLVFVTVWRELRGDFGVPLPFTAEPERAWAKETLAAAAAEAETAGLEAETVSRHGAAAGEICAVARERGVRLIVIGSHGSGAIEGALFGSVSARVLHRAPCPVLVVPQPHRTEATEKGVRDVARV